MKSRNKSMKKKQYIVRDANDLNQRFYEGYDPNFLLSKARTLMFIVENQEAFVRFVEECGESAEDVDQDFREALRAEVYFTEFHQFEAFFALLIAPFQELPHWLYLTTYTPSEIKGKVQAFLDKDIPLITNEQENDLYDFLRVAIYGYFKPDIEEEKGSFQNDLDDIAWLLDRMAYRYLKSIEYNAYKHGVRVLAGPTAVEFTPHGATEPTLRFSSDDSVKFLELEDVDKDRIAVYEVWKHFKPAESINYLYFMSVLLQVMKTVRLGRLTGKEHLQIEPFPKINRDQLNQLAKQMMRFRVSV